MQHVGEGDRLIVCPRQGLGHCHPLDGDTPPHPTQVHWLARDGDTVQAGQRFGTVQGPASSILVAERVALNFMQVGEGWWQPS